MTTETAPAAECPDADAPPEDAPASASVAGYFKEHASQLRSELGQASAIVRRQLLLYALALVCSVIAYAAGVVGAIAMTARLWSIPWDIIAIGLALVHGVGALFIFRLIRRSASLQSAASSTNQPSVDQ